MEPWNQGTLEQQNHEIMEPWNHRTMKAKTHRTVEPRNLAVCAPDPEISICTEEALLTAMREWQHISCVSHTLDQWTNPPLNARCQAGAGRCFLTSPVATTKSKQLSCYCISFPKRPLLTSEPFTAHREDAQALPCPSKAVSAPEGDF